MLKYSVLPINVHGNAGFADVENIMVHVKIQS